MQKMSYKGWAWPENPEKYEEFYQCEPVYTKNSQKVWVFQGMGPRKLTIKGEGVFCGKDAFSDFKALSALFYNEGSGELIHPVWGSIQAYFTELEMTQEPKENEIAYRFTFQQADLNDAIPK